MNVKQSVEDPEPDEPDSEEEESDQSIPAPPKRDFFKEADRQRAIRAAMPIMTKEEFEAQMLRNGVKRYILRDEEEQATPE